MSTIKSFLIFCSGADTDILQDCSKSEVIKYESIGATVFFTGLLATLSGGYALYTIFQDVEFAEITSGLFAIIWGLMIFNLDRYIVSSMRKHDKFWKEFKVATPRILISLLISIVVAKPLEVRILNKPIEEKLNENRKKAKLNNAGFSDTLYHQSEYKDLLKSNLTEQDSLRKKLDKDPSNQDFVELLAKRDLAFSNYTSISKTNEVIIKRNYSKIANIKKPLRDGIIETLSDADKTEINLLRREINILTENIKSAERVYNNLDGLISTAREENKKNINKDIGEKERTRDSTAKIKAKLDSSAALETAKNDSIDAKYMVDDFINHVEVMGQITNVPFSTLWWTIWLITFFIFAIETSPVIVKLLSDKGDYDEKFETRRQKIADFEAETRKINTFLAQNDYRHNALLIRRLDLNREVTKQSLDKLISTIKDKSEFDKEFNQIVEILDLTANSLENENQKNGLKEYINSFIEHYGNVSNHILDYVKGFFKKN